MDEKKKVMKKMKEDALVALSNINQSNVDNTPKSVIDALESIMKHGTYKQAAEAMALFCQWWHADCEMRTYEALESENKKD